MDRVARLIFISLLLIILAMMCAKKSEAQVHLEFISVKPTIYSLHQCPDVDTLCTSRYTQAASYEETTRQTKLAIKNVGYGGNLDYYSIDPAYRGQGYNNQKSRIWNDWHGNSSWTYGVYYWKGKIYISIMEPCPNIRRLLEQFLRHKKRGQVLFQFNKKPMQTKYQPAMFEYLLNPELYPYFVGTADDANDVFLN